MPRKSNRPCIVCREAQPRWGRVCDGCRQESNDIRNGKVATPVLTSASGLEPPAAELEAPLDAAPFADWLTRECALIRANETLWTQARPGSSPIPPDAYRIIAEPVSDLIGDDWLRKGAWTRNGLVDRAIVERVLESRGYFIWDVYFDLPEPEPEPEKPTVDARGHDLTNRRGLPAKLSDAQIEAAYRLHIEAGMSIRELGRQGWQRWGYASDKSAAAALCKGFARLDLVARDRIAATVAASTVHGLATREKQRTQAEDFREHRKSVRRASGETRGEPCQGVKVQPPRKGAPCRRWAQPGKAFCLGHDPERAQERAERLRSARRAAGLDY